MNTFQHTLLRWRKRLFILLLSLTLLALLVWGAPLYLAYRDRQERQTKTAALMQLAEATMKAQAPQLLPLLEEFDMRFVFVPSGTFTMGLSATQLNSLINFCQLHDKAGYCDRDEFADEMPQHVVQLDSFWIAQTEVTNAQFQRFVEAGGYDNSQYWSDDGWVWRNDVDDVNCGRGYSPVQKEPNLPVACISWYEAEAYANWLAQYTGVEIRLPTEAEWEKAARGQSAYLYPWGNEWLRMGGNFCDRSCFAAMKDEPFNDNFSNNSPTGSFPAGASPFGALDMSGNVSEWVADWYDKNYYTSSSMTIKNNPQGPQAGKWRVIRSTNALLGTATRLRTTYRYADSPKLQELVLGFRLAISAR